MERFGAQSYESSEDTKDKKGKKKGDGTTKAAKSLYSVLRVQSEKSGALTAVRPAAVEKKLAHIAGEYTELFGAKSTKKPKEERLKATEQTDTPKEAITPEDKPVAKAVEVEGLLKTETPLQATATAAERPSKITTEQNKSPDKTYEELPDYKVKEGDLFEGEVYIRDKKPVAERVILLQGEQPIEETVETEPAPGAVMLELQSEPDEHQVDGQAHETAPEPEQLSAAESEPDAEPVVSQAGGGEVPPTEPPERPGFEFAQPEEPERTVRRYAAETDNRPEPAQVYREYMQRQAAARHTAAERGVTKEELDDAVYYAAKAGQNRGLLTGLLVGGWYEHRKHKRREKKAEKRANAKIKQLEAARRDYRFNLQQQERHQVVTEARLNAAEHRFATAEKRLAEQAAPSPEAVPVLAKRQQPEQQPPLQPEQLVVPPEHRLEVSSWLSTEIDKKTGKVVERPTFQYGHEYYRERAQEGLPAQQRRTAAGGVALAGTVGGSQGSADSSSLPAPQVPNATMQGNPSQLHTQQDAGSVRSGVKSSSRSSATPLWPWIAALVVIAICLLVALH